MSLSSCNAPRLARQTSRFQGLWQAIAQVLSLQRERSHLARLDDHMLCDIGLTPDAARIESERPIWDAPQNWRK
jgi:uncharacterized protein YjiS (DUF1127 family)